ASGGRLRFVRNTTAPDEDVIVIGVGDLAAVGAKSHGGGLLSLGGAVPGTGGDRTLHNGQVWLDAAESWDTRIGGDPPGTSDFFTSVAHEIGLALGLAESPDRQAGDVMKATYSGERTALSEGDSADVRALYPPVPATPGLPPSRTVVVAAGRVVGGVDFG